MNRNKSHQPRQHSLEAESLFAVALHHYRNRQMHEAEQALRQLLEIAPRWGEAHSNLGAILETQGRLDEAKAHYTKALKLKPDSARILYNLGNILHAQGKATEAMAHYRRALRHSPDFAEAHNNLGVTLKSQGHHAEAVTHYQQALRCSPGYAEAHNNLGNAFKETGKAEEAKAHYERALTLKPDYAEAWHNYAEMSGFRSGDARLKELEKLAASSLPEAQKIYVHFALAKALDDIGDYDRAFAELSRGNALKRRSLNYNEALIETAVERIRDTYGTELFERFAGAGEPSRTPIFIMGMPRSGTTLVEQIISSHSAVFGAGELDNLNRIAEADVGPFGCAVTGLDAPMLRKLGRKYLTHLPALPAAKMHITDKRPLNFFYAGLIRLILPNAKIIHVTRDPVDTCFSCFTKLFSANLGFAFDLTEIGRYYRYYSSLMRHWHGVLPEGAMLDVRYEDILDDFEAQVRRLLDYCELPWEEQCLEFHKTQRAVTTASAIQVRRPLFRTSHEKWRKYERHLTPLLETLKTDPAP